MPKKVTTPPAQPPSKFTAALNIVFQENEWRLPDQTVIAIYCEHIRRLEREIEVLSGGRSACAQRVNPIQKPIPS